MREVDGERSRLVQNNKTRKNTFSYKGSSDFYDTGFYFEPCLITYKTTELHNL